MKTTCTDIVSVDIREYVTGDLVGVVATYRLVEALQENQGNVYGIETDGVWDLCEVDGSEKILVRLDLPGEGYEH